MYCVQQGAVPAMTPIGAYPLDPRKDQGRLETSSRLWLGTP